MATIEIYTTTYCAYCVRAKEFFKARNIEFSEIDVTGDDAAREELVVKSQGRRTVPQIFINGTPVGGYSDLVELDRAGRLMPMLVS